ncbi:glycosyltransferase family A protein [uncultured Desulfovibrio sp.]|uniref:glycosyltransferase family 2 protein n=1 Tax=uncultured Desulfovibrio sp. TaxID=167968 RepID=UPI00260C2992|nr:glycosyltransferase family A protein [uncultured Desulfovibrio sp.]
MSSSTPEITVAMPAYNAASHLLEAIESILAQSFEDFELLVVDDGSTDNTLALAQSCADKRVRVERLPANKGRATARNMAMGRARGRYLAWMDADDIAMPHRLEAQHACLEAKPDIHICGAGIQYFGQSSALELFPEQPDAARAAALFGVPVPNCCVMVRLDAVRAFGLRYDAALARAEDMGFWADALLKAGLQAVNLQEPLLHYRYTSAAHARQWHMRALLGHVFPPLGIRATGAQAALHAGLIYGGLTEPGAALRWLDTLWQAWAARYGHDEYMQRHMLVFMARILREASADAAQADQTGRLLRTLSLAALAENI